MCEESKKTFLKKFLYEPFPVESCLGGRMCEVLNAEISIGTINSLSDAIGYLNWTFYARRVKMNPSYYGAKSAEDEDVEEFFLSVVKETTDKLREHGCVSIDKTEGTDSRLSTTPLGRAATNFYLNCQTPKQMMQGVRGLRKVLAQHTQEVTLEETVQSRKSFLVGNAESTKQVASVHKFTPDHDMYTYAIAKILLDISATYEFNELPVRHNEEELNLELSRSLPWGYDLSKVSWWIDKPKQSGKNILDIMASPHTKTFLLLQAFVFKSKLPISDYINDMRSVVEQIPRLLAAMQFVALDEKASAGNFEMFSCFPLVRRVLSTGMMIGTRPSSASSRPLIKFGNVKVDKELKKGSQHHKGSLELDYNIELNGFRTAQRRGNQQGKGGGFGVMLVLGTLKGGYMLNQTSFNVPEARNDKCWKKHIRMNFDWTTAETNAGQEGLIVLRVIHESIVDSDFDISVSLK